MTAQQAWKSEYRRFRKEMTHGWPNTAIQIINNARRYVREAALERKLEAAQRRIAELEIELYDKQEQSDNLMKELKESIIDQNNQKVRIDELETDLEEYQIREYQVVFPLSE